MGIGLSIPAAIIGYCWSLWRGKKINHEYLAPEVVDVEVKQLPPASLSFLPVILPILLIASKSIVMLYASSSSSGLIQFISFVGDPVIALAIGVIISSDPDSKITS